MPAGRRPKPTALKVMRGNPGKRPLSKAEPKPRRGVPPRPAWLAVGARKHWSKIAAELDRMGVLTTADGTALALLCDALVDYIEARKLVAAEGRTYSTETETGSLVHRPHPAVAMVAEAWKRARSMAIEFGLTPAARAKVGGSPVDDEVNPFDELRIA